MTVQDWDIVLPPNSTLEKIAEASFAEVYRVTTADGRTSILKIMQLKVSTDAASIDMKTAIPVETVISEIRIMNALTEVPGFVTFKDAHLIQGKPGLPIKQAYEDHRENLISLRKDSDFPDPDDFTPDSTFLVIELGDAGVELEICALESVEKVWDIFLGIVIALARAELSNEFEVCLSIIS
jgi:serine/threonine-protein kinase haspin